MKTNRDTTTIAACLFIAIAILFVYWQTKDHSFISFDDYSYVAMNERVQGGLNLENIIWAFKTSSMSNWHPVTWLSYLVDVSLHGGAASGFLLINILLHIASAIILFMFLLKTTGAFRASLVVALLFALHPTRVESVAWVSERKDVLRVFFMFLTIGTYVEYIKTGSWRTYLASIGFFSLGLMSKPMLVSLPLLLLLLDYWPLKRFGEPGKFRKLFTEKIPFMVLAMASSLITYYVQLKDQKDLSVHALPLMEKFAHVFNAYMSYLKAFSLPVNLGILYPFPESISLVSGLGGFTVFVLIWVAVVRERERNPYLIVGWGFFVIALIPVIGIVQVGLQFIADRYTYMPFIGLFIMAAFGSYRALDKLGAKPYVYIGLWTAIILVLTGMSWKQASYWKDNITLYTRTLEVTRNNFTINNKLGQALIYDGQAKKAIEQFGLAVKARPDFFAATLNLASALKKNGEYETSVDYYLKALKMRPSSQMALLGTGKSLSAMGQDDKAIGTFSIVTGKSLNSAEAMLYMGNIKLGSRSYPEAVKYFDSAIAADPGNSRSYYMAAIAYIGTQNYDKAVEYLANALIINPQDNEAGSLLDKLDAMPRPKTKPSP